MYTEYLSSYLLFFEIYLSFVAPQVNTNFKMHVEPAGAEVLWLK